jgi:N-acetylglucosamine-6-phosphate deacetylase
MRLGVAPIGASIGVVAGLLMLTVCSNTGTDRVTVIVGATLLTGTAEVPDAVVVIDGKRIREVGPRPMTPIPQDSQRVDGTGRYVKADSPVTEIATGQLADLVLLDQDKKIERRMVEGKWTP